MWGSTAVLFTEIHDPIQLRKKPVSQESTNTNDSLKLVSQHIRRPPEIVKYFLGQSLIWQENTLFSPTFRDCRHADFCRLDSLEKAAEAKILSMPTRLPLHREGDQRPTRTPKGPFLLVAGAGEDELKKPFSWVPRRKTACFVRDSVDRQHLGSGRGRAGRNW